jgi:cyclophilin family peptidyl-prolyl cis-trans isomerase
MLCAGAACSKPTSPSVTSPDATEVTPPDLGTIARAEDLRRAADIPRDAQSNHDPRVRRAAARALARILDQDDGPLFRALEDDDGETVAWGGYGLGESCKGREASHVRALGARLASLRVSAAPGAIDPIATIVRAIGRCGGDEAEPTLRARLRSDGRFAEAAAYAIGDVVAATGALSIETTTALLDAAQASPLLPAALYPFGRADVGVSDETRSRLVAVARSALSRPAPERIFAVRALGRSAAPEAVGVLSAVLSSDEYTPAERIEAARGLTHFPKAGQAALANAIQARAADGSAVSKELGSDGFGVILAILEGLGDDPSSNTEIALWTLARLEPGSQSRTPSWVRRASRLRCLAAEKLSRAAWDADILRGCDLGDGAAGERARLAALDRGPLVRGRRAAWADLVRSKHAQVREAALGAIARHPELGEAARVAIAAALSASEPGVVATAATVIQSHPDRAFALAALDPAVAAALREALARPWSEDLVQTRAALLDAALAAGIDEGRAYARTACRDRNVTMRARAAKALAAAGEKGASCPAPDATGDPAPELGHGIDHAVRAVFDTDGGTVAIRFDPAFAPIAVTRLVGLARSGFYAGVAVHRVVPGFVAQLGDRGGDGFGGSGELLRCETSPVPFEPLDVGVALAGRDTGSSQMFVALARSPHLDGEYAWVGRAEGDWGAIAEGDIVRAVSIEP